jgi:hypothetical protein
VESGLVLTVFFAMIMGGIDLGRYTYISTTLSNDARAATRQLVLASNTSSDCSAYRAAEFSGGGILLTVDPKSYFSSTTPTDPSAIPVDTGYVFISPSVSPAVPAYPGACSTAKTRSWGASSPHTVYVEIQYIWHPLTPVLARLVQSATITAYSEENAQF